MRTTLTTLALTICLTGPVLGQSSEAEVMATVQRLFDGMRAGDSGMVRSAFHPEARLARATPDGLSANPLDPFVTAIGTPHDQVWDEVIWDSEVQVDGHLAQVWTQYAFYRGDQFSHCGVDAFQLVNTADGWKIFQLTDTTRRDGCPTPPGR
jgi:Putative lumazine-binding